MAAWILLVQSSPRNVEPLTSMETLILPQNRTLDAQRDNVHKWMLAGVAGTKQVVRELDRLENRDCDTGDVVRPKRGRQGAL